MIRLLIKCIIIVLAIQSTIDYLRKHGIIASSINLNYQVLNAKFLELIPAKKLQGIFLQHNTSKNKYFKYVIDDSRKNNVDGFQDKGKKSYRLLWYVVREGETLDKLSQKKVCIGVSSKKSTKFVMNAI